MGQYYKPLILGGDGKPQSWLYSHKYNNGLKLMEHSWLGNSFVNVVENLLKKGGKWHKKPLVWAGDYAGYEPGTETKDANGHDTGSNLYDFCGGDNEINPPALPYDEYDPQRFFVNHTKKLFVDSTKLPINDTYVDPDTKKETIFYVHPLPLLTCEGNGQGGGDYFSKKGKKYIGAWARDIISVETEIPEGYKEIKPNFKET